MNSSDTFLNLFEELKKLITWKIHFYNNLLPKNLFCGLFHSHVNYFALTIVSKNLVVWDNAFGGSKCVWNILLLCSKLCVLQNSFPYFCFFYLEMSASMTDNDIGRCILVSRDWAIVDAVSVVTITHHRPLLSLVVLQCWRAPFVYHHRACLYYIETIHLLNI